MLSTLIVAGGALGISCAGAVAQSPGGASLVGQTRASVGCPAVGLHIIREGSQLSGVVFNLDGSGTSKERIWWRCRLAARTGTVSCMAGPAMHDPSA